MEEISATYVPLGSLAVIFAVMSVFILFRRAINAREEEEAIKNRVDEQRAQKNRSLAEQKQRLEDLLKK